MKEMIRYGLTLAFICVVASASLAGVNSFTKSRIEGQGKSEEEASLKDVLPGVEHFEPVSSEGEVIFYKAYNKEGQIIGVAFKAKGQGYSSAIETMVGMDAAGNILAIKVLSQNETPGLGSQVAESNFAEKFSNKSLENLEGVEAITGATISSRAVIDSVAQKAKEVQEQIKNGK